MGRPNALRNVQRGSRERLRLSHARASACAEVQSLPVWTKVDRSGRVNLNASRDHVTLLHCRRLAYCQLPPIVQMPDSGKLDQRLPGAVHQMTLDQLMPEAI